MKTIENLGLVICLPTIFQQPPSYNSYFMLHLLSYVVLKK
jgi:hypothetical protein